MTDFSTRRARMWLLAQLREEHFSVRLGAVYGLSKHIDDHEVFEALKKAETTDVDNEVRLAAATVLAGFGS